MAQVEQKAADGQRSRCIICLEDVDDETEMVRCDEGHGTCVRCVGGQMREIAERPHQLMHGEGYPRDGGDSVLVPCAEPECECAFDTVHLAREDHVDQQAVSALEDVLAHRDEHLRKTAEELLSLKCPGAGCSVAMDTSHDGCCAICCTQCGQYFCSLCMQTARSNEEAHKHCAQVHGNVFRPATVIEEAHRQLRIKALSEWMFKSPLLSRQTHLRTKLLAEARVHLQGVGISADDVLSAIASHDIRAATANGGEAKGDADNAKDDGNGTGKQRSTDDEDNDDDDDDGWHTVQTRRRRRRGLDAAAAVAPVAAAAPAPEHAGVAAVGGDADVDPRNPPQQRTQQDLRGPMNAEATELGLRLVRVAGSGSEAGVMQLLQTRRPIDCEAMSPVTEHNGGRALHFVARDGMMPALRLLCEERGVAIDPCDSRGNTPLFHAAFYGRTEAVQYLLDHGARLYPALAPGCHAAAPCRPFHAAVLQERQDVVELFLGIMTAQERSGSLWPHIEDLTPLLVCITKRSAQLVRRVLDAGADPNRNCSQGLPPLHAAAFYGQHAIVEELLAHGAIVDMRNAQQRTALSVCAEIGCQNRVWQHSFRECAEYLLSRGASLTQALERAPTNAREGLQLLRGRGIHWPGGFERRADGGDGGIGGRRTAHAGDGPNAAPHGERRNPARFPVPFRVEIERQPMFGGPETRTGRCLLAFGVIALFLLIGFFALKVAIQFMPDDYSNAKIGPTPVPASGHPTNTQHGRSGPPIVEDSTRNRAPSPPSKSAHERAWSVVTNPVWTYQGPRGVEELDARDPVIGIDLGTATTTCAILYQGKVHLIPDAEQGNNVHLSQVWWDKTASTMAPGAAAFNRYVGGEARGRALHDARNTVFGVVRLLGHAFSTFRHKFVSKFPFKMVNRDSKVSVPIQLSQDEGVHELELEQVLAAQLSHVKLAAEVFLGGVAVNHAVLAVPSQFSYMQRQTLRDAAQVAGLTTVRLVSAPAAVGVGTAVQGLGQSKNAAASATTLVVDFGAGSLDASVLVVADGVVEVEATTGTDIGGLDFDHAMMDHLLPALKKTWPSAAFETEHIADTMLRLRYEVERCKIALSSKLSTAVQLEFGEVLFTKTVTRKEFEEVIHSQLTEGMQLIKGVLKEAFIAKSDVDAVIAVGGSTRMPVVRRLLTRYFAESHVTFETSLGGQQQAVAYGAAVLAGLDGPRASSRNAKAGLAYKELEDMLLLDVAPFSLGLDTGSDGIEHVIPKNTVIPREDRKTYSMDASSRTLNLTVLAGGLSKKRSQHTTLGTIDLRLPPLGVTTSGEARKSHVIELTFQVDWDGMLHVSAKANDMVVKDEVFHSQLQNVAPDTLMKMRQREVVAVRKGATEHLRRIACADYESLAWSTPADAASSARQATETTLDSMSTLDCDTKRAALEDVLKRIGGADEL